MKNIHEVRKETAKVFEGMKSGEIDHKLGSELVNAVGKIIQSLKVEIEYYALREEKPTIPYFAPEKDESK